MRWKLHRFGPPLYICLALLCAVPILTSAVPLGVDTLNHLARIHIRAHIGTDVDLARLFSIRTELRPYLGMDLLLTPFATIVPTVLVGRVYLLSLVLGLIAAIGLLQRVFTGAIELGPFAGGLIAYNGLLAWGLINYLLGLITALVAFAAWHAWRDRRWPVRLAIFTVLATVIYFTHLLAFVMYGLLVASYEGFGRKQPWHTPLQDWLVLVGQAIPALVLWSLLSPSVANIPPDISYDIDAIAPTLLSPFLFSGAVGGFEAGQVLGPLVALGTCISLLLKYTTLRRELAAPAIFFLFLAIVTPTRAFSIDILDYRFPLTAFCLIAAGLRLTKTARRFAPLVIVALMALTAVRVVDVSTVMSRCDRQYAELRDGFAPVPRGAELTTVLERAEPERAATCTDLPIYNHMAQLITIDRSGYASGIFSWTTGITARGGRATDTIPISAHAFLTPPLSRYVVWFHLGRERPAPAGLALLRHGGFFDLWAVPSRYP